MVGPACAAPKFTTLGRDQHHPARRPPRRDHDLEYGSRLPTPVRKLIVCTSRCRPREQSSHEGVLDHHRAGTTRPACSHSNHRAVTPLTHGHELPAKSATTPGS